LTSGAKGLRLSVVVPLGVWPGEMIAAGVPISPGETLTDLRAAIRTSVITTAMIAATATTAGRVG
jgi:hypothetical protein